MFELCRDSIDAIATAALAGPFALCEVAEPGVFLECDARGYFKRLKPGTDFFVVTSHSSFVGTQLRGHRGEYGAVLPFDTLKDAKVNSVVILDTVRGFHLFEMIDALAIVSPNNIYAHRQCWNDRTYRRDHLVERSLRVTGPMAPEGLSSVELLAQIVDCLLEVKHRDIPGDIVNLGVYKGWSMHFLAEICRLIGLEGRAILGFDTFQGFPDLSGDRLDTFVAYMKGRFGEKVDIHTDTSRQLVSERLAAYGNITLIEGDISQTVAELSCRTLSLALFDMDDYSPTKIALQPAYDALSPGGFIVHDHFSLPSCEGPGLYGQRSAMVEFLAHTRMFNLTGTNVFIKT